MIDPEISPSSTQRAIVLNNEIKRCKVGKIKKEKGLLI